MTSTLRDTARALVAEGKGILAADESFGTIEKRFTGIGVESSEDNRRAYREMLFTTPGAGDFISGVILFDETLRQSGSDGRRLVEVLQSQDIVPGIKVDKGTVDLPGAAGEKMTEGLDGLRKRLEEYHGLGARFTKWRATYSITDTLPSRYCYHVNAHALARYAALSQEQGLVPIVEPEVLMDGPHSIDRCHEVTREALNEVFEQLFIQRVSLEGMLLKPNMVLSGTEASDRAGAEDVARATVACLREAVPAAVPGIVFLSGGQSDEQATAHLDAMNRLGPHPWELSFSYGRALQSPSLKAWQGAASNVSAGQQAFLHRARCNSEARYGRYSRELEQAAAGR
ncbi:MAG TPA: class I fructose-bisphosphate aldolase [Actinomycetota bacterium]|nr:class I fructose-bisphosphate aldolase [Actinomycetota bacterium]